MNWYGGCRGDQGRLRQGVIEGHLLSVLTCNKMGIKAVTDMDSRRQRAFLLSWGYNPVPTSGIGVYSSDKALNLSFSVFLYFYST